MKTIEKLNSTQGPELPDLESIEIQEMSLILFEREPPVTEFRISLWPNLEHDSCYTSNRLKEQI